MARAVKREAAKRDLTNQWIWYAENANIETADRFFAAVERTLRLLARQPESGALFFVRSADLHGMRRFPVGDGFEKILLFYFPLNDGIDLVRVVRGSRDLERLFSEGSFG